MGRNCLEFNSLGAFLFSLGLVRRNNDDLITTVQDIFGSIIIYYVDKFNKISA